MSLIDRLETANEKEELKPWKGTFREFLRLFETGKYPNMGALAHRRVYNMIMAAGTKKVDHFGQERIRYAFFEDYLFGLEDSIDKIMSYLHGAAQRSETSKRMLLLYGPPSSGKSDLVQLIKRGLEAYTRTDDGAIFALTGSKMHENPFTLIPHELRLDFAKQYDLRIEGELSPMSRYTLETQYANKFMDFPVEQIYMSEAKRIGIGTWLPSDPKCLTDDCLILTGDGLRRGSTLFREFDEEGPCTGFGTKAICGLEGLVPIKACHNNGCRHVYQINARGLTIKATNNHRFLTVASDGTFEHCHVQKIVGQSLVVKVGTEMFGRHNMLRRLPDHVYTFRHDEVDLPYVLTPNLSRLAGYLVAEGYSDNSQIGFSNQDNSLNRDVQSILAGEFLIEAPIYERGAMAKKAWRNRDSDGNVTVDTEISVKRGLVISKHRFVDFMNLNFSLDKGACEKKVPDIILATSRVNQLEFLEGLYLGDGCARVRDATAHISYGSCSLRLVQDIQAMLLNLGVFGGISSHKNRKYPENSQYKIVCEGEDAFRLAELLPRFMKHRRVDFAEATHDGRFNYESFGDLFGLITEIRESTRGTRNIINRRYMINTPNKRSPTRQSLIKWKRHLESDECNWIKPNNKDSIIGRIDSLLSYRCIPVVSSEYVGMEQVYDLEVDHEDHVFIVNGMVSHNSQDISELVGGLDMAKIQDIGDESDPRAYNFDGEFFAANRGIMEWIEGLKSDERFLRSNLTVTQEKSVKAPRFGLIYLDMFIVMHTNEEEFKNFMKERKYEAYHDRMVIVDMRYNQGVDNEVRIYEKLLDNSDTLRDMHVAPNTLNAAAMFAILSRLEPPPEGVDLSLAKKMKLYNKKHVKGHKIEQVPDLKQRSPREGLTGISPRFVIDQIIASISQARDEERDFITPLDILKRLNKSVNGRDSFTQDQKTSYKTLLDIARKEWNTMLQNDIQKAFFLSFDDEARNLCNNYLDQIEAASSGQNPRDPITGDEVPVDESLMESIEDQIGVSSSGREDFRNEILRAVGYAGRHDKKFDYTEHASLKEAIQKQLFEERQNVIRMTTTTRNPDEDELKRINEVVGRMVEKQGYSAGSANELLKYATAHLFEK